MKYKPTFSSNPLMRTLFLASSHMSVWLSFQTCAAILYSSINGSLGEMQWIIRFILGVGGKLSNEIVWELPFLGCFLTHKSRGSILYNDLIQEKYRVHWVVCVISSKPVPRISARKVSKFLRNFINFGGRIAYIEIAPLWQVFWRYPRIRVLCLICSEYNGWSNKNYKKLHKHLHILSSHLIFAKFKRHRA